MVWKARIRYGRSSSYTRSRSPEPIGYGLGGDFVADPLTK